MELSHNHGTAAKDLVLTKLYDRREQDRSEIARSTREIRHFCRDNELEFNRLKWFEYAYTLLYSGHAPGGKVLEVGSAKSGFPYYLASKGYDVTTIDSCADEYRRELGERFGVTTITADLREFQPELENTFDLISNLSVVEHIDDDTQAVLNLGRYLRLGGVMVISTDFFPNHIEYPDANRKIVTDRPEGSHTDSRVYTPGTFLRRVIQPLEAMGVRRMGKTDLENVDINNPQERAVRGLYTFGVSVLKRGH